jgi:hypothetical protein
VIQTSRSRPKNVVSTVFAALTDKYLYPVSNLKTQHVVTIKNKPNLVKKAHVHGPTCDQVLASLVQSVGPIYMEQAGADNFVELRMLHRQ